MLHCPDSLTWPAILALDEAALNTAIDQVIYGMTWRSIQQGDGERGDWWQCTDEPGVLVTRSSVPYHCHTASWDRTMALLWSQRISLMVDTAPEGRWSLWADGVRGVPRTLCATTEAEARDAICRLALWQSVQQEARP